MAGAEQRKELIAKIRALPAGVEAAVKGLGEEQLDTRYRKDGWTVRQVVHHLADAHLNAFMRTKLILTEDKPTLKTYKQDAWAVLLDASKLDIQSSLLILHGLHERWSSLLDSLPASSWARAGIHPERGEVTLADLLKLYAHHGENHLKQIADLHAAKGW